MSEPMIALANHIASGRSGLPPEWQDWAEELESSIRKLAEQPQELGESASKGTLLPHNRRELVNELRDTALKYQGCQQLREQINGVLDKYTVTNQKDLLRQKCLVMWVRRLAYSLKHAKPESKLVADAMTYLKDNNLISVGDCLR
ncbi:TPA: hypothetical protein MB364_000840 [Klebsiella variicola subsp. variicola]|nr:hypothetical protein [Klebsiella variicola subsp. variicola]